MLREQQVRFRYYPDVGGWDSITSPPALVCAVLRDAKFDGMAEISEHEVVKVRPGHGAADLVCLGVVNDDNVMDTGDVSLVSLRPRRSTRLQISR